MAFETSGDQSPNTEMFRLQFAASQWSKLVFNAEGLFNKLMSNNALPANEQILLRNQIEQWLCMKQEYEDCITGDESGSLQEYTENTRRSLERIEEVTETDESESWMKSSTRRKSYSGSESEAFDDEDQSDLDSENTEFLDKLEEYMLKFKHETDKIVDSKRNNFSSIKNDSLESKSVTDDNLKLIAKPISRNQSSRRTSILPYSEMSNELAQFQKLNSNIELKQKDDYNMSPILSSNSIEKTDDQEKLNKSLEQDSALTKALVKVLEDKDKSLVEPNERISRLDHLLKEKLEIERLDNMDDKETLRQEIHNLRHIKDRLIDMKCKYTSEKTSPTIEKQRQLLLISEYVETIDAMIEHKNVMICGKFDDKDNKSVKFDDQLPIMSRLEKLSHDELVTLFCKYFHKVIDLKDSSRNLEIQNATLEETLNKQIIDSDTRMIMLQKSYEKQISLLLNYYGEETSSSSYDDKLDQNKIFERLIKENQALRNSLAHFNSLLKASGSAQAVHSNSVKNTKQVIKPELMQIALPSKPDKTTKVTRQGNKLIIQTNKQKK